MTDDSWDTPDTEQIEDRSVPQPIIRKIRPERQTTPLNLGRTPPIAAEAEQEVIGACLIEGSDALGRCIEAGLTVKSFHLPANRVIYQTLLDINKRNDVLDLAVLAQELMEQRTLEAVGGMAYLMEITQVQTTIRAGYFIEKVRQAAGKREIIDRASALLEHAYNGDTLEEVQAAAEELAKGYTPVRRSKARSIHEFRYPSDDDPNILIGKDDYLGRGGGMLFVSHAGAGKSSWIMDACMMWGLGRPWMGLKCSKPLRSLIIQAEDSDRYIGKISASFAHKNRLDDKETEMLGENCKIVRLKGVSGPAFFTELKRLTALYSPDIVIINPIYLYAEGDIGRSEFAQPFLLGLDQVNVEEKFAYILIHHTGKPTAKGKDGKRAEVEDWESAYMGFGSSYLANWPRCTALLEPIPGEAGKFMIKLGKGGFNAGLTREVAQGAGTRSEPITRIAIRHSTEKMEIDGREKPVFYWEQDELTQEVVNPKGAGRKQKYEIDAFLDSIPETKDAARPSVQIHKAVATYSSIPVSSFKDLCERAAKEGRLNRDNRPSLGVVYWWPKNQAKEPQEPQFL